MSRFDQYRRESDLPPLRKLQPGEEFTATLIGIRDFKSDDGTVPILDFTSGDGDFAVIAGAWKLRDELAFADPKDGDVLVVARLADRGRSQDWTVTVNRTADDAVFAGEFEPSVQDRAREQFGDEPPWEE
jgi:hypothetical protein